jgi:pimeloyl-ACP methyl ester carboxylesterase
VTLPRALPSEAGDDGLELVTQGDEGAPILWLHGYTLDSSIWSDLWARLPGWRHLGVTLPGHAASRPLRPTEDLAALARSLAAIAAKHGARHLVGLSFGGMVALQVAAEAPAQFTHLVLGAPALGGGPIDPHAQTRNLELMRLYRERGPGRAMTELWMQRPPEIFTGAAAHPELWERLRRIIDRHSWSELADWRMQALIGLQQTPAVLARVRAATRVVIGDQEMEAFKRNAELIRRGVRGCVRDYLPGTGHLCLLESPAQAAQKLEAHFSAV